MSSYVRIGSDPDAALRWSSPEEISVSTVFATAVGTGHHMLKVECYSLLKAMHAGENGSFIESPEFNAGGHAWRLRCYLNGKAKEDAGFVSVDLCLTDASAAAAAVYADFEIALVHHQGTLLRRWRPSHGYSAACSCNDAMCKRHHATPPKQQTLWEEPIFAKDVPFHL